MELEKLCIKLELQEDGLTNSETQRNDMVAKLASSLDFAKECLDMKVQVAHLTISGTSPALRSLV